MTHFHLFALLAAGEKLSQADSVKGGGSGLIDDETSSRNQTQRKSMIDGKALQGLIALILPTKQRRMQALDEGEQQTTWVTNLQMVKDMRGE
jgi:hypothetical protein